jgi:hypothetical protein
MWLMWLSLTLLIVGLFLFFRPRENATELWKTYALALEVIVECDKDAYEIKGEGCMTRSRRLGRLALQRCNAACLAANTLDKLRAEGEYE